MATLRTNEGKIVTVSSVSFLGFQIKVVGEVFGENPLSLEETIEFLCSLGLNSAEINWLTLNAVAGKMKP